MKIEDWGLIDYELSSARQLERVDEIADGGEERLILCTHPPVVTLGRGARSDDVLGSWSGPVISTSRGGRATYHGPSQLVIYPMIDLRKSRSNVGPRDVHAYLRALEEATVSVLREMGLKRAESRTTQSGDLSLTGVWLGDKKIASIGIAVRKWVTYHGLAINLFKDDRAFQGINPCGFSANVMTSIEAELGQRADLDQMKLILIQAFKSALFL